MSQFRIGEAREDVATAQPTIVRAVKPVPIRERADIARTSAGLRETLFRELEDIRAGRSDQHRAKAVASLAAQIIASVRMEIEFAEKMKDADGHCEMNAPLELVKE